MVVAGALLAAVVTGLLAAYNLMLGAAAVLVLVVVRDTGELRAVLWVMTTWSTVLGAWWILSYLQGQSREFNVLGDPNFFSGLQVIVVPLAVALISHTSSRLLRLLLYAALAIIAASIVASLSRGGMVALLVVAVVMLIIP